MDKRFLALHVMQSILDASEVLMAVDRLEFENGNVLVATLYNSLFHTICADWCKLFGKWEEKHHWKKLIDENEHERFRSELESGLQRALKSDALGLKTFEHVSYTDFHTLVRGYRDKFVAHLDQLEVLKKQRIPSPRALRETTLLLYSKIYKDLGGDNGVRNFAHPDQFSTEMMYKKVSGFHKLLKNGIES
ncbi:hypothetical protein [Celeribacter sp.]|uniref:hypothetical protein n=1 Tax=Celeribacter sp. TaxID=1890673 RepID=UPI003A8F54F1